VCISPTEFFAGLYNIIRTGSYIPKQHNEVTFAVEACCVLFEVGSLLTNVQ
jgi:hypothetical protein